MGSASKTRHNYRYISSRVAYNAGVIPTKQRFILCLHCAWTENETQEMNKNH
jgi:hypothetical protein